MGKRSAGRLRSTRAAAVLAAALLAGLLGAGCAHSPSGRPQLSLRTCVSQSVAILRRHIAVSVLPPACQGLSRSQLSDAAGEALAAVVGPGHGKRLMRARRRELSALLPRLSSLGHAPGSEPVAAPAAHRDNGRGLGYAAFAAWLLTVGLGIRMMVKRIARAGRRRSRDGTRRLRPGMDLAHLGLAVAGLALWAGYLASGLADLAWAACALLLPVTGLGMSLLVQRVPRRLPVVVTAAHVSFAVATMMLTLLAAIAS